MTQIKAQSIFIAGTDTGVGKTYIACQLIKHYVAQGYKVVGMKPISAGCDLHDGQWVNEDVQLLTQASNVKAPLHLINPYCFRSPIAPHIAAQQENATIELKKIAQAYQQLSQLADIVIVEGAGGLLVPINTSQTMADIAKCLNLPIMLVVGLKLGCINHTLLTVEAIHARQLTLDNWVANPIDLHMQARDENIQSLNKLLKINCLQF